MAALGGLSRVDVAQCDGRSERQLPLLVAYSYPPTTRLGRQFDSDRRLRQEDRPSPAPTGEGRPWFAGKCPRTRRGAGLDVLWSPEPPADPRPRAVLSVPGPGGACHRMDPAGGGPGGIHLRSGPPLRRWGRASMTAFRAQHLCVPDVSCRHGTTNRDCACRVAASAGRPCRLALGVTGGRDGRRGADARGSGHCRRGCHSGRGLVQGLAGVVVVAREETGRVGSG